MSNSQTNLQKAGRFKTLQDFKARQNSKKKKKRKIIHLHNNSSDPFVYTKECFWSPCILLRKLAHHLQGLLWWLPCRDLKLWEPTFELLHNWTMWIMSPDNVFFQSLQLQNKIDAISESRYPKMLATAFFLKQTKRFDTELQQTLFDSLSLSLSLS